jgi:hypothetical protein
MQSATLQKNDKAQEYQIDFAITLSNVRHAEEFSK